MAPYMLSWCVLELLCFVVVCCCSAIRSVKHAVLRVVMCAVICAVMCAAMYNAMRAAMRAVLCAANYVRLNYIEKIRDKTLCKVTRHKSLPFKWTAIIPPNISFIIYILRQMNSRVIIDRKLTTLNN